MVGNQGIHGRHKAYNVKNSLCPTLTAQYWFREVRTWGYDTDGTRRADATHGVFTGATQGPSRII